MSLKIVITFGLFAICCPTNADPGLSQEKLNFDVYQYQNEFQCSMPVILHALCVARYIEKYLKRHNVYSVDHPGSYNPSIITNQEARMIYENMDRRSSALRSKDRCLSVSTIKIKPLTF